VTSYPGFGKDLGGATYVEDRVVVDGKVVTSRGPGTALEFALTLVRLLKDERTAKDLGSAMLAAGAVR
jgi:4-methyl-5(b-hydroxyethyl)-thiazole monophosphate biosynthesis